MGHNKQRKILVTLRPPSGIMLSHNFLIILPHIYRFVSDSNGHPAGKIQGPIISHHHSNPTVLAIDAWAE